MNLVSSLLGIYSLLIIIRIIFTWFGNVQYSRPAQILAQITDPYLNWWRRTFPLRAGFLDLSPLLGMAALSVAQTICSSIARRGKITIGAILAVCLSALWSAASFILGFCFIVLVLRLIAYVTNSNTYSPFWQAIDSISRPLLYRINRIFFGRKIPGYMTSIIVSLAVFAALWLVGGIAVHLLAALFFALPF
ncbi:MAG: YggT family protein [Treponema sp.]|nr:YggT family protein [Treponema sp.]